MALWLESYALPGRPGRISPHLLCILSVGYVSEPMALGDIASIYSSLDYRADGERDKAVSPYLRGVARASRFSGTRTSRLQAPGT